MTCQDATFSDGTAAGTFRLKDINPGTASSFPTDFTPVTFPNLGDRVLFRASTALTGTELWITDGTAAGTQLLKDILPGPGSGI